MAMKQQYLREQYQELLKLQQAALVRMLIRSHEHIDEMYHERCFLLGCLATMALELGYPSGVMPLPVQQVQIDTWRFVLVIDLPSGQISFPLADDQLPIFGSLPAYRGEWRGYPSKDEQQYRLRYPGVRWAPTEPMSTVVLS